MAHAAKRALERYDLLLSWDDLAELSRMRKEGHGFIRAEEGSEQHVLIFKNRVLAVAFKGDHVVTVLPRDAVTAKIKRGYDDWIRARLRGGQKVDKNRKRSFP